MNTEELFGREVEDDHDLLTYNESAARLREEIEKTQMVLADLLAKSDTDDGAKLALIESATTRLNSLQESAARNSRAAANDQISSGFLRYSGPGSSLTD
ncbi:hypothetical protein [Arthrobacter sp. MMS18-M83]|uniref:hypothetical protein n=1 Tax=Arthrobacter sp. MMS18-M83 TaxID=2996261 RepID=UPI00227A6A1F|nr:hypothetical protein [Arthrobacter sp. MMS18-M83]WAH97686.1 hypothetical protein OW521_01940 [Arthrobacter sp. MMS18-M83]